jgi:MFS transporter, AAHS family, 4-hydroxybenzoate transporter
MNPNQPRISDGAKIWDGLGSSRGTREFDVEAAIDNAPLGFYQIAIALACTLVIMIDGFANQSIAFVAPVLVHDWALRPAVLGAIFSIGLFGGALSAMVIGPLGGRFGRKPMLVVCMLVFALASILTARSTGATSMLALRLLTGIGVGGAMPLLLATTAEYSPRRFRATIVSVMYAGFPLGSVLGGLLSIRLIPMFGWQSVFYLSGLLPLALLPLVLAVVPESNAYLVAVGRPRSEIERILRRLGIAADSAARLIIPEHSRGGAGIQQLFRDGRALATVLIGTTCFMGVLLTYVLVNWTPTLLKQSGYTLHIAVLSSILLNLGTVLAAPILGRAMDRFGPYRIIGGAFVIGAAFDTVIGWPQDHQTTMLAVIFLAGFFSIGAQLCVVTLATIYYPTYLRATGIGMAMVSGRVGAVVGPSVGGGMLAAGFKAAALFQLAAAASVLASLAIFLMLWRVARPEAPFAARAMRSETVGLKRSKLEE